VQGRVPLEVIANVPGREAIRLRGDILWTAKRWREAAEQMEQLFGGPDHYVLRVRGQSMIEDHIDDGDYVVIRKQETASNGERVVAMIENEVTLKRFFRDKNNIRLEPANGAMKPIVVEPHADAHILGVLVGVLRKY